MHPFDRPYRTIVFGLLLAACAALGVAPSGAWAAQSDKAKTAALPEPLTHESVRELVSRLSDEEVRKLLLDQLDRAAVPAKAKGDQGMSGTVEASAGMVRTRLGELRDARPQRRSGSRP